MYHLRGKKIMVRRKAIDLEQFGNISLHRCLTLRSLAASLYVRCGLLSRFLKARITVRHSKAIKPSLSEGHVGAQLEFCVSMLDNATFPDNSKFSDMYNNVHIDEKWFYMKKKT